MSRLLACGTICAMVSIGWKFCQYVSVFAKKYIRERELELVPPEEKRHEIGISTSTSSTGHQASLTRKEDASNFRSVEGKCPI